MECRRADSAAIAEAARLLRAGELVAFATETVYGLGADARSDDAVAKIFRVKGRTAENPLIVHAGDVAAAREFGEFDERAERLAAAFWPGALSLVLPRKKGSGLSEMVTAGLETVALRVPSGVTARELLRSFGGPVAAPSANLSGGVSATEAGHVVADFGGGGVAMVLDDGACRFGLESSVAGLFKGEVVLLRRGAVGRFEIEEVLGMKVKELSDRDEDAPLSPGRGLRHYAPGVPVRLGATGAGDGEGWIGFGVLNVSGVSYDLTLDAAEAGRRLYSVLRELGGSGVEGIAVGEVPGGEEWDVIRDRLRRASEG